MAEATVNPPIPESKIPMGAVISFFIHLITSKLAIFNGNDYKF
jgi:hypothetical protein